MSQSIGAPFTLSIKMHLGHQWTTLNYSCVCIQTGDENVLNTVYLALPNNSVSNVYFCRCSSPADKSRSEVKSNRKWLLERFRMHSGARCELQSMSSGAQHSLDISGHIRSDQGLKECRGRPSRNGPWGSIKTTSPSPPTLESPHWTPEKEVSKKDTGHSFYITSWLSVLLLLSALPCFRTGKGGKTENGAPRSCWVPLDKESFLGKESFYLWISSRFWVRPQNPTSAAEADICSITPCWILRGII